MADSKADTRNTTGSNQSTQSSQGRGALASRQEQGGLRRRDPLHVTFADPFELMDRMSDEMDRWFNQLAGGALFPRAAQPSRGYRSTTRHGMWFPRIEAVQKGDTFVVSADLPGLKKEDVSVELTDDAISIRGERRDEHQEEREGVWRSEREYGQFHRTIPLPEGVIAESAQATFRDGVLEITMKAAPQEANRGRRLEIQDASNQSQK